MNNFDEDKKIYLTSSIFYYNDKMYYEDDDIADDIENPSKYTKLTLRNWLKYLDEYGWEEINDGWKKRLGYKNSCNYGLIDCGGGGNCLFHCIAQSLNKPYEPDAELYDYQDIRDIAADQINQDNLDIILINYRALKEAGDFDGYWDDLYSSMFYSRHFRTFSRHIRRRFSEAPTRKGRSFINSRPFLTRFERI